MSLSLLSREREPLFLSMAAYLAIAGALGVAMGYQWYVWFAGEKNFLYVTAVTVLTTYLWALFGLAIWELLQRFPLTPQTLGRDLPAYAAAGLLLLLAQQVRFYFFGGFGSPLRRLSYGHNLTFFFRREGIFYLLMCSAIVVLFRGIFVQRRMQRLALRSVELEQQVVRMELDNLRARLQPHFLFNALNTISAFVRDSPSQADRIIELLARLLRRNLEADAETKATLGDELTAAQEYLEIQQMRFGSRMRYHIESVAELTNADLPPQLLQPLIENAVVHSVESSDADIEIRLHCWSEAGHLMIAVENTRNDALPRRGFGTGLSSVARRLKLLYGDAASLTTETNGVFRVRIVLPLTQTAEARETLAEETK